MKTDFYTRAVLTVIAACLLWICVGVFTPAASAQTDIQKVMLVDARGMPLSGTAGLRVNLGDQPLAVSLPNQVVPVVLRGIERTAAAPWEPIFVDVLKTPPTPYPVQ
jgi:hypothetical protein